MATMEQIAKQLGVSKGDGVQGAQRRADISETLRKTIVETAVALGYTRARRGAVRTLAVFIENMDYARAEDFGADIITGFRQMAEPAGYDVRVIDLSPELERGVRYDEYMLREGAAGRAVFGLEPERPLAAGLPHQPHPGRFVR